MYPSVISRFRRAAVAVGDALADRVHQYAQQHGRRHREHEHRQPVRDERDPHARCPAPDLEGLRAAGVDEHEQRDRDPEDDGETDHADGPLGARAPAHHERETGAQQGDQHGQRQQDRDGAHLSAPGPRGRTGPWSASGESSSSGLGSSVP